MKKGIIQYKPMPHKNRFWVYAESCYTEEELNFRQWVLKTRSNCGIHADYLVNPDSWFAEDNTALINTNENSWFYANTYKPRHTLSRDDFHVQPVDSQRLQWPALYDLMQKTGDYLLIRNEHLSEEHLNQPMNFVLLDINNMLKTLSQNPNINQVKEQLELMTKYIRTIEKNVSPIIGSDRLFLATLRGTIDDEIHPYLTQKIDSQLLRERLQDLLKTINQLSVDRNRILHFALNINPVNPHPYGFSTQLTGDIKNYPTQAVKECSQPGTDLMVDSLPPLIVTAEQLKDCPNFKLITMGEAILSSYSSAISDLNELNRFQNVITQIIELLGQAGEVYTIYQFREQMIELLKQIDGFIDNSSQPIAYIIHENTLAYNEAIQAEQDLPMWKSWLTMEKMKLKTYIKNQDTLAQFPSTPNDLAKTNSLLKEHVNQVLRHLSQSKGIETSFATISGKAQELNALMDSMHHWITHQYLSKGLEAPKAPEPLRLLTAEIPAETEQPVIIPTVEPVINSNQFFTPQPMVTPYDHNNALCLPQEYHGMQNPSSNIMILFMTLTPLWLIVLFIIISRLNKNKEYQEEDKQEHATL